MAASFRAVSSASGTGDVTPAVPTGTAENDILILAVETANETVTAPSGYTEVDVSPFGGGTAGAIGGSGLAVFWKRAGASETAPTVTDPGNHALAVLLAYQGAITAGNPFNATAESHETTTNDTSVEWPAVTTTIDNCLIINIGNDLRDATGARLSGWTNSNLSSLTERYDGGTTSGNGGGLYVADGLLATAGDSGATTGTIVSTSGMHIHMTLALLPNIILGDLTLTQGADTISSAGDVDISGLLDKSQDADTITAEGTVSSSSQDLTATLVTNDNSFGTHTVSATADVIPTLVSNTNTFGVPVVTTVAAVTTTLVSNSNTFGTPSVSNSNSVTTTLVTNSNTFGTPSISVTNTLIPTLVGDSNTFGTPTVTATVGISPTVVTNSNTFYTPTISLTTTLSATVVTNSNSFYTPVVTTSSDLVATLVANSNTFYPPTISVGSVDLYPTILSNSNTFYTPSVGIGALNLEPTLVGTGENTFYPVTVTVGTVTVAPTIHVNSNVFGNHTIFTGLFCDPTLFENTNTFYNPSVTAGAITISPTHFENTNLFYNPSVSGGVSTATSDWLRIRRRRRTCLS